MTKVARGPISKKVRNLCYDLRDGRITDEDFKEGIRNIIICYGETWRVFQNIGMVPHGLKIQKYLSEADKRRIWRLLDETDYRIREAFEIWKKKMSE